MRRFAQSLNDWRCQSSGRLRQKIGARTSLEQEFCSLRLNRASQRARDRPIASLARNQNPLRRACRAKAPFAQLHNFGFSDHLRQRSLGRCFEHDGRRSSLDRLLLLPRLSPLCPSRAVPFFLSNFVSGVSYAYASPICQSLRCIRHGSAIRRACTRGLSDAFHPADRALAARRRRRHFRARHPGGARRASRPKYRHREYRWRLGPHRHPGGVARPHPTAIRSCWPTTPSPPPMRSRSPARGRCDRLSSPSRSPSPHRKASSRIPGRAFGRSRSSLPRQGRGRGSSMSAYPASAARSISPASCCCARRAISG